MLRSWPTIFASLNLMTVRTCSSIKNTFHRVILDIIITMISLAQPSNQIVIKTEGYLNRIEPVAGYSNVVHPSEYRFEFTKLFVFTLAITQVLGLIV